MNECLTTPQLKNINQLLGVTKYVNIHNVIKYSVKICTLYTYDS